MKTLLLISDLISRSQVQGKYAESVYIKDIASLITHFENNEIEKIILDLNNEKLNIAEVLSCIQKLDLQDQTTCFFSHVRKDLAELALKVGITDVVARSKFFA